MSPQKQLIIILFFIIFSSSNTVYAQLWRYLDYSPTKEKAFDRELKKEAFSVVTKKTVFYGDTFSYDLKTYLIKSFDYRQCKVTLWEKPFDGHKFHIEMPNESLIIEDFGGLIKVHHLSDDLLEIVYNRRGGSNDGYDNVLILGINKDKICIVMEIQSLQEFAIPSKYGLYNLRVKLKGRSSADYKLTLKIFDMLQLNKPLRRYKRNSKFSLKFNNYRKVFFNEEKSIDINCELSGETITRHFSGVYPAINLKKHKYYFIDKNWYVDSFDKTTKIHYLESYTFRP